jgi:methylmalonyl-CoA mutase cobalamin-binding domain/chain
MTEENLFDEMKVALIEFRVDPLVEMIQTAIQKGIPAEKVIEVLFEGMNVVGAKYQAGEYFVTMLIIAGEVMKEAMAVLKPHLEGKSGGDLGKVVLATVAGDIHDIGKNILSTLLTTAGFEVIDLGIDVAAEDIVEAVKAHRPLVLGMSALLTTNLEQFPQVVALLEEEGVRDGVKVIVGGATVTKDFARAAGVDAYAKTAVDGVNICKEWAAATLS